MSTSRSRPMFISSIMCSILFLSTAPFNTNEFRMPYNTTIKPYTFLYEEPSVTLQDIIAKEPSDSMGAIFALMARIFGDTQLLPQFTLQLITANDKVPIYTPESTNYHPFWSRASASYLEVIELDNDGENIILRGSSTIALAVAFNWYLEDILNTTYDWHTYSIDIPSILPLPPFMQKRRCVPFMYYQNVCTASYTFAFWDWSLWEKHIDWMALQGINMPLAFNGQEYVFAKTFAMFNFTSDDLQSFFAGPGFYAWQRMGNIQGWGGPLREYEIVNQYNLQLQILARMYTLEMTPVLTCFAGHVPNAITRLYPNADVSQSPEWNGFSSQYCCVYLLNFTDPLFQLIGAEFIRQQTKYYGTSHLYQCDTFNEMQPPNAAPAYLQSASSIVYGAISAVDESAVWLLQGWLFFSSFWNNVTIAAYLSGVKDDAMIILDLESEARSIYNNYESFYGKPFIWNTLHDFGGHNGIIGNLADITQGFVDALNFANTTVIGVGTTMEGIWQNYIVYDTTYKMGYRTDTINLTSFGIRYAYRRYGLPHTNKQDVVTTNKLVHAWLILVDTLYHMPDDTPPRTHHTQAPRFGYDTINWDPLIVQKVWKEFVGVGDTLQHVEKFRYDLVEITRQSLSDLFNMYYHKFSDAYEQGQISTAQYYADKMIELMSDMDRILLSNRYWMLGTWIKMARNQADDEDTKKWYEFNARNQITLWGPNGEINNYAEKQWGDIVGTYYLPQWQAFLNQAIECMKYGIEWNQDAFDEFNYAQYELPFSYATGGYHTHEVNDTIDVAYELYTKWNLIHAEDSHATHSNSFFGVSAHNLVWEIFITIVVIIVICLIAYCLYAIYRDKTNKSGARENKKNESEKLLTAQALAHEEEAVQSGDIELQKQPKTEKEEVSDRQLQNSTK